MAHSNREKRKAARLAQKRARKAAWAALIGTSQNKKKAKATGATKLPPMAKVATKVWVPVPGRPIYALKPRMFHAGPRCHNIGCKRCSKVAMEPTG